MIQNSFRSSNDRSCRNRRFMYFSSKQRRFVPMGKEYLSMTSLLRASLWMWKDRFHRWPKSKIVFCAHMACIASSISNHLAKNLSSSLKAVIDAASIRQYLFVSCQCLIDNQRFDSLKRDVLILLTRRILKTNVSLETNF